MNRIIKLLASVLIVMTAAPSASSAEWDLKDILGKYTSASADSTSTGSDSSSKTGGLGEMISGVANALGIGSSRLTVDQLVGTWTYTGPAIAFQSENFLKKAGGAVAAQQIESKLEPYYKSAGLTSLVMTVAEDSTFTFKAKMTNFSGTMRRNPQTGNFIFNFKAFKKINVGSMEGYIVMNGGKMELTFDVSKLMTLVEKAGTLTGNTSVKALSALLKQYDGMTAGFALQRKETK